LLSFAILCTTCCSYYDWQKYILHNGYIYTLHNYV
jgi:hypothetical protein